MRFRPAATAFSAAATLARRRHHRFIRLVLLAGVGCSGDGPPAATPPTGGPPVVSAAVNVAPTAQFSVSPRWPQPGDTVTFDGTFSYDGDGQVVRYTWDFGNGVTQVTGATAKTVFRSAGTYTVHLTALDDSGSSAATSLALVVNAAGAPAGAVDSAQSSVALSSSFADAGVPVTATVTARTAAGAGISGVAVQLSASGRRSVIVQPATVTNGAGVATGTVAGLATETKVVRALADFTAIGAGASLIIDPTTVSATRSAVRITQTQLASAVDSAIVEVTVRDTAGNAVSGIPVTLTGAGGTISVTSSGVTDVDGRTRLVVVAPSSCNGTAITLTAWAGGVQLSTQPVITAAGPMAYGVCGVSVWLDADDATTQTVDGSNVLSEWRDKSGRVLPAIQASAAQRPVVVPGGLHGKRVVRFGPTQQRLLMANALARISTSVAVFMVSTTAGANGGTVFAHEEAPGPTRRMQVQLPYLSAGSGYWDFGNIANATGRMAFTLGTSVTDQRPSVWHFSVNPNTAPARSVRRDRGVVGTASGAEALSTVVRDLAIGGTQPSATDQTWFTSDIAELLILPRAVTSTERTLIENALMVKWLLGNLGVTAGDAQSDTAGTSPPVAPQVRVTNDAGTGVAGVAVTFQVTTGGARIAGATSATVTTDASGYAALSAGAWVLDAGTNVLTVTYGSRTATITGTGTLPTGVRLRYDFGDSTTMFTTSACTTPASPGAGVGCVTDKSGNATHATNPGSGMALRTATGLNGRNSLSFPNVTSDHYLVVTNAAIRALRSSTRTVIAAVRATVTQDATTNAFGGIAVWPGWHAGLYVEGYPAPTTVVGYEFATLSGPPDAGDNMSITAGQTFVATHALNAQASSFTTQLWRNGVASPNGVQTAGSGMTGTSDLYIGQAYLDDPGWRWRFGGTMGEIIVYTRLLTTAERQIVERYLGWKWGVTIP